MATDQSSSNDCLRDRAQWRRSRASSTCGQIVTAVESLCRTVVDKDIERSAILKREYSQQRVYVHDIGGRVSDSIHTLLARAVMPRAILSTTRVALH
jgi:hypothetical protein